MNIDSAIVYILLAVKDGEAFLEELVDSLRCQSEQDFVLLVKNDASSDNSMRILRGYEKVRILDDHGAAGVVGAYGQLIRAASGRYLMFADQDDVWHPDKVAKNLTAMRQAEALHGAKKPILVHSDLRVCDENMEILDSSFVKYQALEPRCKSFRELIIQNNITGCTVMINRALAELADLPGEAICHDWYLGLIAAAFGEIIFLQEPLVDYRQHGNNFYGAVKWTPRLFLRLFDRNDLRKCLRLTQRQARAFAIQYAAVLDERQRRILDAWSGCEFEKWYFKRLFIIWKYRLVKNNLPRTLGLWWAA